MSEQTSADVAAMAQPYLEKGAFAGAVLLAADRERVLSVEAVGLANLAENKPMQTDSVFWIASQTKPITGTAVMMLVEQGKISLDDPVSKYLPEFKTMWVEAEKDEQHVLLRPPSREIMVRDVLAHLSGLPFCSATEHSTLDGLTLAQACRSYSMMHLMSDPGTKYAYSNAGTNTAGRIIEVVTDMSYQQFLDRRLFGPLGMDDTTFWPTRSHLARLASSYSRSEETRKLTEIKIGQLRYPLDDPTRQPMPAGGLFSTARDCARFCQMILRGGEWAGRRYLSEASVATMVARHTPMTLSEDYGLAWGRGGGGFGHGGAFCTTMWIEPQLDLVTVFLIQHAGSGDEMNKCKNAMTEAVKKRFGKSQAKK